MPAKGRDFTPAQKGVITKAFRRNSEDLIAVKENRGSFIPYPKGSKLPGVDGSRTNKGIFFKFPGGQLVTAKIPDSRGRLRKKYVVQTKFKKVNEVLIPFPEYVKRDMDGILHFIKSMEQLYKPDYVMWNVNGTKGRRRMDYESFTRYAHGGIMYDYDGENRAEEGLPYYTGIFLGFTPN